MYFCYLLKSINEKYQNDTYIGFTDDPIKRLRQHNGNIKGGAKKTSKKRPWVLVVVISNFPNKILALKFEWAWANPFISTFSSEQLKNYKLPSDVQKKNKKKYYETLDFKISVLNILLNSKVFEKISLYLHIFDMGVFEGKSICTNSYQILEVASESNFKEIVKSKIYYYIHLNNYNAENTVTLVADDEFNLNDKCIICGDNFFSVNPTINNNNINISDSDMEVNLNFNGIKEDSNIQNENNETAMCPYCKSLFHLTCLAYSTLENSNLLNSSLIPKDTQCLVCENVFNWTEFIK